MTGDVGAYMVSKSDVQATSTLPDPLTEGAEIEELSLEQPKESPLGRPPYLYGHRAWSMGVFWPQGRPAVHVLSNRNS